MEYLTANQRSIVPLAWGVLQSSRAFGSLIAGIIVAILARDWSYGVATTVFFLFSYIFNDVCDWTKDRIAHPERPIARGLLPRRTASAIAAVLFFGGVALAWVLVRPMAIFFALLFPASALYSAVLKRAIPAFATPWWCLLGTSVFLLPTRPTAWQFTSVFAFFLAREILLDFRDRYADGQFCRTKSLPGLLGRHTFGLVLGLQLISLVSTIFLGSRPVILGNIVITVAAGHLAWLAYTRKPWEREGRDDFQALRLVKHLMWIGFIMALGI